MPPPSIFNTSSISQSPIGNQSSIVPLQSVNSCLYVLLDCDVGGAQGWSIPPLVERCLAGGARVFQVRAKRLAGGAYLALCDEVMALARPAGAVVIVNDRADTARLCGASGVHVGQDDLAPSDARKIVGSAAVVGLSTHTVAQARAGVREPVDYVAVGPVFGTASKVTGYDAVGLELVREASALAGEAARQGPSRERPVVAIGGITLERAPSVIAAGAAAVAVMSDLLVTGDPESRVRAYLDALGR